MNLILENFVYAELHDQDKADTSNLNMPNLSQKKLIHSTVGEKKINDKYCNKTGNTYLNYSLSCIC